MTKQDIDEVKEEISKEEDEFYGEETVSGSSPRPESDDDVEEIVKEVTGNPPEEGKPFSIAEEVKDEEEARRGEKEHK